MKLTGYWRIVEMESWDAEAIDLVAPASWVGIDEGDDVSGRGWAALNEGREVEGRLFFHNGDDSGFRAVRA